MRTPEQIGNLRKVLIMMYGPFMVFASDKDIDAWGDSVQLEANKLAMKKWSIKVRLTETKDVKWEDVEPEKKHIIAIHERISGACWSLLVKHPKVDSVELTNVDDPTEKYYFSRDEKPA